MVFNSEMFEIYNVNGTHVELVMGNYTTIPKYREVGSSTKSFEIEQLTNGKGRNLWVTVSDENIFILYQDYSKKEEIVDKNSNILHDKGDRVLVFDWNGNPVKIYKLDSFVMNLDYDKTTNRLWTIHHNPDNWEPEIIYFEL